MFRHDREDRLSSDDHQMIGDNVVGALGHAGPRVVLAGLFLVATVISQLGGGSSQGG
jgi:hypothetical protein